MNTRINFVLLAALAAFAPAQLVLAQQDDGAEAQAEEDDSWRKKSLRQLRKEYQEAEEGFYDAFNAVNSDDEFDISCKSRRPLGSRRRERACQAKFLWEYEEELANASARTMTGAGDTGLAANQTARLERMQTQLRGEMSSMIAEVPAVSEAFARLAQAKRRYEAKQAE